MKIKWFFIKEKMWIGEFEDYRIDLFKREHGGWCYIIIFRSKSKDFILDRKGYYIKYINNFKLAKAEINKKITFFYAQQQNKKKKMQVFA